MKNENKSVDNINAWISQVGKAYKENMVCPACRKQAVSNRNVLCLFAPNIISVKEAAKTMIHEYTHYRYNIGNCQHAEAICFAYEKMHNENREFLYDDEWEYVKGLAIYAYPVYNWAQGGHGNYE